MAERVRRQDQLQPAFTNALCGAFIHMCLPGNPFAQTGGGVEPGSKPPGTPPAEPRPGPFGRPNRG